MKPVLTGTMSDLQVIGWGVLSCIGGRGWGGIPFVDRFGRWFTGVRHMAQLVYRCSPHGLHVLILTTGLQVFATWLTRAALDNWFTGVAGMFCHSGGVGGIP